MVCRLFDVGLTMYNDAWQLQKQLHALIKDGSLASALIVCRHYPVITLGRAAKKTNILIPETELREKGIEVYEIERGGDVTYHGPGQLTVYPLIHLAELKNDLHFYLRKLEYITIEVLSKIGITASSVRGLTGVWVKDRKIASIGLAVRRWITFHGISINVEEDDLANFKYIRPCGLDVEMTSVETEQNSKTDINEFKKLFLEQFQRGLGLPLAESGGSYDKSYFA